jgi:hypothetical protein
MLRTRGKCRQNADQAMGLPGLLYLKDVMAEKIKNGSSIRATLQLGAIIIGLDKSRARATVQGRLISHID